VPSYAGSERPTRRRGLGRGRLRDLGGGGDRVTPTGPSRPSARSAAPAGLRTASPGQRP